MPTLRFAPTLALLAALCSNPAGTGADDSPGDGWVDLSSLSAWKGTARGWSVIGDAHLDAKDPKKLAPEPGTGAICNGPVGKVPNIATREVFGDVEVHLEFLLPKGSNSGIKFQEVYEVQLFDSFGVKEPKGTDLGGVYPHSEEKPKYHHIDGGHPPLANAAKPPGEWQTLDATFIAPKFDASGKKVADARISATINGKKVQDDLKVDSPTGAAYKNKEKPTGALLLQGDHGPVAYRNLRAREIKPPAPAAPAP